MINKKDFMVIFFFTIILLLFPCPAIADYPDGYYEVGRIIDGDTFELEDGRKVRLIGIDTPEIDERCSVEAKQKLISLISDQKVYLEKHVSETGRYGRLLRYVYSEEGIFINLALVQDGYAVAAEYPPVTKYAEQFANVLCHARNQKFNSPFGQSGKEDKLICQMPVNTGAGLKVFKEHPGYLGSDLLSPPSKLAGHVSPQKAAGMSLGCQKKSCSSLDRGVIFH